jgi:chromosome segregation and condensation protein ScpB
VQKHIETLKKKGLIEKKGKTTGEWEILIKK